MKDITRDGLLLCDMQGNVFVDSLRYTSTSSDVFIRRFMASEIIKDFDCGAILDGTLSRKEIIGIIEEEYGKSTYGKNKYNKEVLYWMGYLYRYMAFTYDLTSFQTYKIVKPKELNVLYYTYHTLDCKEAIERIFESKEISFDPVIMNEKLLKLLRKKTYEKEVSLESNLVTKDCYTFNIKYKGSVVGEVKLDNVNENNCNLSITIKGKRLNNDEMIIVVTNKAMDYAKVSLSIATLQVELFNSTDNDIRLYKKMGFIYTYEKENSSILVKRI